MNQPGWEDFLAESSVTSLRASLPACEMRKILASLKGVPTQSLLARTDPWAGHHQAAQNTGRRAGNHTPPTPSCIRAIAEQAPGAPEHFLPLSALNSGKRPSPSLPGSTRGCRPGGAAERCCRWWVDAVATRWRSETADGLTVPNLSLQTWVRLEPPVQVADPVAFNFFLSLYLFILFLNLF